MVHPGSWSWMLCVRSWIQSRVWCLDAVQHPWVYPSCTYTNIRCLWYNEWTGRSVQDMVCGWPWIQSWSDMDGPGTHPETTWENRRHLQDKSQMRVAGLWLDPARNLSKSLAITETPMSQLASSMEELESDAILMQWAMYQFGGTTHITGLHNIAKGYNMIKPITKNCGGINAEEGSCGELTGETTFPCKASRQ